MRQVVLQMSVTLDGRDGERLAHDDSVYAAPMNDIPRWSSPPR